MRRPDCQRRPDRQRRARGKTKMSQSGTSGTRDKKVNRKGNETPIHTTIRSMGGKNDERKKKKSGHSIIIGRSSHRDEDTEDEGGRQ
jgi:phosphoglucomutase